MAFSSHHQFQFDLILLLAFNVQSLVLCKLKMFAHCEYCENVKVNFSCLIKTAFLSCQSFKFNLNFDQFLMIWYFWTINDLIVDLTFQFVVPSKNFLVFFLKLNKSSFFIYSILNFIFFHKHNLISWFFPIWKEVIIKFIFFYFYFHKKKFLSKIKITSIRSASTSSHQDIKSLIPLNSKWRNFQMIFNFITLI